MLNLRIIGHCLRSDLEYLPKFSYLEQVRLDLRATITNHQCLRELRRLKVVTIDRDIVYRDNPVTAQNMQSLLNVLGKLPHLESLHFTAEFECSVFDTPFDHFENLKTLTLRRSYHAQSLACLTSCRSLRVLNLWGYANNTDFSAIGALSQLEELHLSINRWPLVVDTVTQDYAFLSRLVNLKTLEFHADWCDLAPLHTLVQLRKLTIVSNDVPVKNYEILGQLPFLRELDIAHTMVTDLTPLIYLQHLRTVIISKAANCRILTDFDHPSLLHVFHPSRNCLWKSSSEQCE